MMEFEALQLTKLHPVVSPNMSNHQDRIFSKILHVHSKLIIGFLLAPVFALSNGPKCRNVVEEIYLTTRSSTSSLSINRASLKTALHSYGIKVPDSELHLLLQPGVQGHMDFSKIEFPQGLQPSQRNHVIQGLQALRAGDSTPEILHRQLYTAINPAEAAHLPLAKWPRDKLSDILANLPQFIEDKGFGLGNYQWLPSLLKIAQIKAEDSQSPSHQYALAGGRVLSKTPYASAVLWTGTEASPEDAIAIIDTDAPRVVVSGELFEFPGGRSKMKVHTVEVMIKDRASGFVTPQLYEYTERGLERVFESRDGVHSIARCFSCHGAGADFSAIPFKNRLKYEPSPGWFDSQNPRELTKTSGFGFWRIHGLPNLYNGIKKSRFDFTKALSADSRNELLNRLVNGESLSTLYNTEQGARWIRWKSFTLKEPSTISRTLSFFDRISMVVGHFEKLSNGNLSGEALIFQDTKNTTHVVYSPTATSLKRLLKSLKDESQPFEVNWAALVHYRKTSPGQIPLIEPKEFEKHQFIDKILNLNEPLIRRLAVRNHDGQLLGFIIE